MDNKGTKNVEEDTTLQFSDLTEAISREKASVLGFMNEGTSYERDKWLTPRTFFEFILQYRTVRGQNSNSILTKQEIEKRGLKVDNNAIAFYNDNNDKCYDIINAIEEKSWRRDDRLVFENTSTKIFKEEGKKVQFENKSFENFCKSMKALTGIELQINPDKNGLQKNIWKTLVSKMANSTYRLLGDKVANAFKHGILKQDSSQDWHLRRPAGLTGTYMFSEKNVEVAKDGDKTELYRQAVAKYMEMLCQNNKLTRVPSSLAYRDIVLDYYKIPHGVNMLQRTAVQNEILDTHRKAFQLDANLIEKICRDLAASEIAKTLPSVPAKYRFEQSQAYLMRAAKEINMLNEANQSNPLLMQFIKQSVNQDVVRFNVSMGYTVNDVRKLYAQVGEKLDSSATNITDLLKSDCEASFADDFAYTFAPKEIKKEQQIVLNSALPRNDVNLVKTESNAKNNNAILPNINSAPVGVKANDEHIQTISNPKGDVAQNETIQIANSKRNKLKEEIANGEFVNILPGGEDAILLDAPKSERVLQAGEVKPQLANSQANLLEAPQKEKFQQNEFDENVNIVEMAKRAKAKAMVKNKVIIVPAETENVCFNAKKDFSNMTIEKMNEKITKYMLTATINSIESYMKNVITQASSTSDGDKVKSFYKIMKTIECIKNNNDEQFNIKKMQEKISTNKLTKEEAQYIFDTMNMVMQKKDQIVTEMRKNDDWKKCKTVPSVVKLNYGKLDKNERFCGHNKTFYGLLKENVRESLIEYGNANFRKKLVNEKDLML